MKKIFLIKSTDLAIDELIDYIYNNTIVLDNPTEADFIIVAGGDGAMLKAIRSYRELELPFVGFNYGHIGFLMNKVSLKVLKEILSGKAPHKQPKFV